MSRPDYTTFEVTAHRPENRFGEVSLSGTTVTYTVQARVWPGKPITAERLAALISHEHKVYVATHGMTWRIVETVDRNPAIRQTGLTNMTKHIAAILALVTVAFAASPALAETKVKINCVHIGKTTICTKN